MRAATSVGAPLQRAVSHCPRFCGTSSRTVLPLDSPNTGADPRVKFTVSLLLRGWVPVKLLVSFSTDSLGGDPEYAEVVVD